ncbi:MAG: phosphatidate cytidylyltransferase [Bacteroidales bacterium]|nr:phosphatidate cytidylyltransferase [Bacteroidales bacterium]
MKNLISRTLTGIVFTALIIISLLINEITFLLFFILVMLLCLNEFFSIIRIKRIRPQFILGNIIATALFVCTYLYATNIICLKEFSIIILLSFFIFIIELYRKSKYPFHNIAFTILGIIYIAVPFSLLPFLVFNNAIQTSYNFEILLSIFIILWTNDTGAYLTGITIGKHRLFERISPKKSWEGSIGGLFFAVLAAVILSHFFKSIALHDFIIMAFLISIFGTYGDLAESLLKRFLGIKDSGKILPGHGGMLDRFDSFIFVIPVIFTYINFISILL